MQYLQETMARDSSGLACQFSHRSSLLKHLSLNQNKESYKQHEHISWIDLLNFKKHVICYCQLVIGGNMVCPKLSIASLDQQKYEGLWGIPCRTATWGKEYCNGNQGRLDLKWNGASGAEGFTNLVRGIFATFHISQVFDQVIFLRALGQVATEGCPMDHDRPKGCSDQTNGTCHYI